MPQVLLQRHGKTVVIRITIVGELLDGGYAGIGCRQWELCESAAADGRCAVTIQIGIDELDIVSVVSDVVERHHGIGGNAALHFQVPFDELRIQEFAGHVKQRWQPATGEDLFRYPIRFQCITAFLRKNVEIENFCVPGVDSCARNPLYSTSCLDATLLDRGGYRS